MDPEVQKQIVAILGPLLGALIGGGAAMAVGWRAQRTSVLVERDKAVRGWRARRIGPLLDYSGRRFVFYAKLGTTFCRQGHAQAVQFWESVEFEEPVGHVVWPAALTEGPGSRFGRAVVALRNAEAECHRTGFLLLRDPQGSGMGEFMGAVADLDRLYAELEVAAEIYVHHLAEDRRTTWADRLLRLRLWVVSALSPERSVVSERSVVPVSSRTAHRRASRPNLDNLGE
jgi:hypothetical protein